MKNRILIKTLAMMMMVGTLAGTTGITAHAADNVGKFDGTAAKMISQVFDAKYYAEMNPDVVAVFGTNEGALLNHYLTSGIYEGRDASAEFNADAYASANADLVAVYNSDNAALEYTNYFYHYLNCGKTEGRIATVADATKAGFTVVSASDETKVVAQPMLATKMVRSYNAPAGGSSSSGSSVASYLVPASNSSGSAIVNNTVSNEASTPASASNDEGYYGNPSDGSDYSDAATIDRTCGGSDAGSALADELDWD